MNSTSPSSESVKAGDETQFDARTNQSETCQARYSVPLDMHTNATMFYQYFGVLARWFLFALSPIIIGCAPTTFAPRQKVPSGETDPKVMRPYIKSLQTSSSLCDKAPSAISLVICGYKPVVDSLNIFGVLIAALSECPDLRTNAALALGKLGDKRAVDSLLAKIRADSDSTTYSADFSLDDKRVADSLLAEMQPLLDSSTYTDPVPNNMYISLTELNRSLVFALGDLRDSRATKPLVSMLTGQSDSSAAHYYKWLDPSDKKVIIQALGKIGDSGAIEPILRLYQSQSNNLYLQDYLGCALALEQLGWSPAKTEDSALFFLQIRDANQLQEHRDLIRSFLLGQLTTSTLDDIPYHFRGRTDMNLTIHSSVGDAVNYLIDLGWEETLGPLASFLDQPGVDLNYREIAQAYLNSKNSTLETAARKWAARLGVKVTNNYSSTDFRGWGSIQQQ